MRLLLWVITVLCASLPLVYGALWLITTRHPAPPPAKPDLTRLYNGWTLDDKGRAVEPPDGSAGAAPKFEDCTFPPSGEIGVCR